MKQGLKKLIINVFQLFNKPLERFCPWLIDSIMDRKVYVKIPGENYQISYRHYGPGARWRASSSLTKEKNTIKWINSFQKGSNYLDVGASIGVFTLYPAKVLNCSVVAIEPSGLQFSRLCLNISDNKLGERVLPISAAVSSKNSINYYHMTKIGLDYGGGNSFDAIDARGTSYNSPFKQGIVTIKLDDIYHQFGPFQYVKIDIDGHEEDCFMGAVDLFKCTELKSVLIELNEKTDNYNKLIDFIHSNDFILDEKLTAESYVSTKRGSKIYNHIFHKKEYHYTK